MYQAGAEWRRDGAMAFVEWTDSTAEFAGVAYNHLIYTDGYRYKGRPLGHWVDGDSNLWTAGGLLRDLFGGQALAVLRYGTLNESGASPSWPTSRLSSASLQWRRVFDRVFGLTLALDHCRPVTARDPAATTHAGATRSCACSSTPGCIERAAARCRRCDFGNAGACCGGPGASLDAGRC